MSEKKKMLDVAGICAALAGVLFVFLLISAVLMSPKLDWIQDPGGITGDMITVYESETADLVSWRSLQQLNVFEEGAKDGLLMPGCSGTYSFTLENTADFEVSYNIAIADENIAKVPMEFRVHTDNAYVVGSEQDWVEIDKLQYIPGILEHQGEKEYNLDWRWSGVKDAEDTAAGIYAQKNNVFYLLNFLVTSEQSGYTVGSEVKLAKEAGMIAFFIAVLLAVAITLLDIVALRKWEKRVTKYDRY